MFTPDDRQEQFNHIMRWHKQLVSAEPLSGDDIVWHYTTGSGLIGIISSGTIYSTQAACLNDASEIRYGAGLVRKALQNKLIDLADRAEVHSFIKLFAEATEDSDDKPNHAANFNFVTCFSRLKDDLSQWRSYGGGENGYALGVRVRNLLGIGNTLVAPVNYDADFHTILAKEIADVTISMYEAGYIRQSPEELQAWQMEFLNAWNFFLSALAPFAKHPAFHSEKEVRLVHGFQVGELEKLVVVQKATLLARHLPLKISAGPEDREQVFPIEEVIVGPARHKAISAVTVKTLLTKHGYSENVNVTTSKIPFQST